MIQNNGFTCIEHGCMTCKSST